MLSKGGRPRKDGQKPVAGGEPVLTLAEMGISKRLSVRGQRLASLSEEAFEAYIAGSRQHNFSVGVDRFLDAIGAMTPAARRKLDSEPLTDNGGHSERCGSPFCDSEIEGKKGKKFCSDRCRMDAHVLRRAKAIVECVGVAEFLAMLERI